VGALLYFAPAYLGHLASYWEILLFVVGLVLIACEIFVIPGFGIAGISGILLVVTSLALAMVDNAELWTWDGTLNLKPIIKPVGIVILSCTASIFGSVWLVRKLFATRSFDHIALREEMKASEGYTGVASGLESLIGQEVVVFSDLKPSGKVKASDGHIYEAVMKYGGFASKNEVLVVVDAQQGRLYCE
jgi:membrane-bound serine protease (ClpP class)